MPGVMSRPVPLVQDESDAVAGLGERDHQYAVAALPRLLIPRARRSVSRRPPDLGDPACHPGLLDWLVHDAWARCLSLSVTACPLNGESTTLLRWLSSKGISKARP